MPPHSAASRGSPDASRGTTAAVHGIRQSPRQPQPRRLSSDDEEPPPHLMAKSKRAAQKKAKPAAAAAAAKASKKPKPGSSAALHYAQKEHAAQKDAREAARASAPQMFPVPADATTPEAASADDVEECDSAAAAWAKAADKKEMKKGAKDPEFVLSLFHTAVSIEFPKFHWPDRPSVQHGKKKEKENELEKCMEASWGAEVAPKVRTLISILNTFLRERIQVSAPLSTRLLVL